MTTARYARSIAAAALLVLCSAGRDANGQDVPVLLEDVFTGASSSLPLPPTLIASPRTLVASGEAVFFAANDGTHGVELWRSGGSSQGAFLVKDIFAGSASSSPQSLTDVGGTLYFTADDGVAGRELWRSNGTEAGTHRVRDIAPGSAASFVDDLVDVGGTLFFGAYDGSYALWRSDGTEAGTAPVKYVGFPRMLVGVGETVFFVASDLTSGRELWRSDGTGSGTVRVKDIVPGSGSPSILDSLIAVGDVLFFRVWPPSAGVELWRSDGTEAGTVRVKDVTVTPPRGGASCATAPLSQMIAFGGTLFFSGEDAANPGVELWRSDGTADGTLRVKDIFPGAASNPQCLVASGGNFFFSASDGTNGTELWRSDGTAAGTVRVTDIAPGLGSSAPHFLADVGGTLFFAATSTGGTELWRSDGSEAGTFLVADLRAAGSSSPQSLVAGAGMLFFSADDGVHGREPWVLASDLGPSVGEAVLSAEPSLEGSAASVSAMFAQPGAHTHTCTIEWGDGSQTQTGSIDSGVCSASHAYGDDSSFVVTVTVIDDGGRTGTSSTTHIVSNVPPIVTAVIVSPEPSDEGATAIASATFVDPGISDGPFSCTVNYGDGSGDLAGAIDRDTCIGPPHVFVDDGADSLTVSVMDKNGGAGASSTTHIVSNRAPVITSIDGPVDPIQIGAPVDVSAVFTDQGSADTHTCTIVWHDTSAPAGVITESAGAGTCSGSHLYAAAGIYEITVTIADDDGAFATKSAPFRAVIYDPDGGFVTGGGWINSPPGAYVPDPSLSGKASFAFASKYQRNGGVPAGQTEFQFQAGDLNFHSSAYEWLVISGAKARYRGTGKVNGVVGYGFEITASDGQADEGGGVDRFRIKIWNGVYGNVVYDNQLGTPDGADPTTILGGGSIVVRKEN